MRNLYRPDVERRGALWKAEWPDYCRACNGWGIWCDALPPDRCHRCGGMLAEGPENSDELPRCTVCDWQFDDGAPVLRSEA
jgi:hypothetical protein